MSNQPFPTCHNVTKQSILLCTSLDEIKSIISTIRSSLTPALYRERELEHELEEVASIRRNLSQLQTAAIIKEAELQGRVTIIKAKKPPTCKKEEGLQTHIDSTKLLFSAMSDSEREEFLASILNSK